MSDTILKETNPRTIPARFGLIWFRGFRGEHLNVKVYNGRTTTDAKSSHGLWSGELKRGKLSSMNYYLCLFAYSGVQHILCWFFSLFVLCTLCCQFHWIVHLLLPLRYSLTISWLNYCYTLSQMLSHTSTLIQLTCNLPFTIQNYNVFMNNVQTK